MIAAKLLSLLFLEPSQLYDQKHQKLENEQRVREFLQPFVIWDCLASWIFLTNLLTQLKLQTIYVDRSLLREQSAAKRRRESQTNTAEQNLNRRVRPRHTLQNCCFLLEEIHQDRRQHHACWEKTVKIITSDVTASCKFFTRARHENSTHCDLSYSLLSCDGGISVGYSIVVRHWNAILKLSEIIQQSNQFENETTFLNTNCIRIKGMFIQLAAATAARGTNLGNSPVEFWVISCLRAPKLRGKGRNRAEVC